MPEWFAHSVPGRPRSEWEALPLHLALTGERAARNAASFGWGGFALLAGLLHDIGKCSAEFQAYIAAPPASGQSGPNHSSAGAVEALRLLGPELGRILAFVIAGHHAGLADGAELFERLGAAPARIPRYAGWEAAAGELPAGQGLRPSRPLRMSRHPGFSHAFLIRMLFSALVDADFLATEDFYNTVGNTVTPRGSYLSIDTLNERLRAHMARLTAGSTGPVAALRAEVLRHTIGKAASTPGLFTLTVPTGGGKTLASLSFALEHAQCHQLRRVVVVIPFTSIIEQTAAVCRQALATEEDVLEHHAAFDWDKPEAETRDGRDKLRRAAENWDAPVVVTTAVQFFESLFAARTSRCRKLHNLAGSVIVVDEAQMMPLGLLRPCMAALEELAANYGASVVLCTATQPALRVQDGFKGGLDIPCDRELAPDPPRLYAALKRVRVERLPAPVEDATILARFAKQPQMLCIVNTRGHARALFAAARGLPGAVHLSTLMCAKHRSAVLAGIRQALRSGEPVRICATSVLEAGVDLDLPEVWRAAAGLDSIAQAAGRCNRNGERAEGRVVVFEPANPSCGATAELRVAWDVARDVLPRHGDPLGLAAVRDYFGTLYWNRGPEALDSLEVDGTQGVLTAIRQRAKGMEFPFRSIADGFRFIEDGMQPIVIPFDDDATALLTSLAAMEKPAGMLLRRLQPYVVSMPRKLRAAWLAQGALAPVNETLGDALLRLTNDTLYDAACGLNLDGLGMMGPDGTIF